jgi:hypothetical protein
MPLRDRILAALKPEMLTWGELVEKVHDSLPEGANVDVEAVRAALGRLVDDGAVAVEKAAVQATGYPVRLITLYRLA